MLKADHWPVDLKRGCAVDRNAKPAGQHALPADTHDDKIEGQPEVIYTRGKNDSRKRDANGRAGRQDDGTLRPGRQTAPEVPATD